MTTRPKGETPSERKGEGISRGAMQTFLDHWRLGNERKEWTLSCMFKTSIKVEGAPNKTVSSDFSWLNGDPQVTLLFYKPVS